jgi:hypothetical protein
LREQLKEKGRDAMSESRFGGDTEFEEEETSSSADARAGFDSDSEWNRPVERVVEETSEDDVNSAEADRAAGYNDEDLDDDDGAVR